MRGIPADSDQDMFTKLKAGGGDQYDIVFANAGFCPFYHEAGLIEPLDLNQIPAAKNLWPIFRTNTDFPYVLTPNQTLLYPSMWASFGIVWNIDSFKVPPPYSWKSLWDAPKGKVILQGAGDDFLALAGLALGVPRSEIYSMTGPTLKKAADYLRQLKPFQISNSSDLVTADAIRTGQGRRGPGDEPRPRLPDQRKGGQARGGHPASQRGRARLGRRSAARQGRQEPRQRPQVHRLPHGRPGHAGLALADNVFGMASQTTSERIMKAGAKLNAPIYDALGG